MFHEGKDLIFYDSFLEDVDLPQNDLDLFDFQYGDLVHVELKHSLYLRVTDNVQKVED